MAVFRGEAREAKTRLLPLTGAGGRERHASLEVVRGLVETYPPTGLLRVFSSEEGFKVCGP